MAKKDETKKKQTQQDTEVLKRQWKKLHEESTSKAQKRREKRVNRQEDK